MRPRPAPPGDRARGVRAWWIGRRGERAARRALRRAGYRVLARNLRTPHAEVDLLCREGRWLVLVEVKSALRGGVPPHERLEGPQRRRLARALGWIARRGDARGWAVRVDLVAVTFDGRRPLVTILRDMVRADPR